MLLMMHDKRVIIMCMCSTSFHFRGHPWILLWAAHFERATTPPPFFIINDGTQFSRVPFIVEYSFRAG